MAIQLQTQITSSGLLGNQTLFADPQSVNGNAPIGKLNVTFSAHSFICTLEHKSPAYVFGEQILKPAIDASCNIGQHTFSWLKRGLSAIDKVVSRIFTLPLVSVQAQPIGSTTPSVSTTIQVGFDPNYVAITPDGSQAYITNLNGNAGVVSIVDTATNTVGVTVAVDNNPSFITFTPDGSQAYVINEGLFYTQSYQGNSVDVINVAQSIVVASVPVGLNPVCAASTPDGKNIYVLNAATQLDTSSVSVIDTGTNAVIASINIGWGGGCFPLSLTITPDGTQAYVMNECAGNGDAFVSVIDTTSNLVTAKILLGPGINNPGKIAASSIIFHFFNFAVFSPSGDQVYLLYGGVNVINTTSNVLTTTIPVGNNPMSMAITPDGSQIYVVNAASYTVSVIDTDSNNVTTTIPVGISPQCLAITPDGSEVYVANNGAVGECGTVSVIDTSTNSVFATIPVDINPTFIAITPDGSQAYLANGNCEQPNGNCALKPCNINVISTGLQQSTAHNISPNSFRTLFLASTLGSVLWLKKS